MELIGIVAVAVTAFVSTNVDNLLLLVAFFSDRSLPRRSIYLGYAAALAVVMGAGLVASWLAVLGPPAWLRFLGLLPIALGSLGLARKLRGEKGITTTAIGQQSGGVVTIASVMLANAGDSLAVFIALFADTRAALSIPIAVTGVAMSILWSFLASRLVAVPQLGSRLERIAGWTLPLLLITIGFYILLDTPTDREF